VKKSMNDWKTLREKVLSNAEVREEYERLRPQFELASELIKLRTELGLTQREMARLAGVTQPEIARIESGKIAPRWDKVVKLVKSVGASVEIVPPKKKLWNVAPLTAAAGRGSTHYASARTGRFMSQATKDKTSASKKPAKVKAVAGGERKMPKRNVHTVPRETGWANKKEGASKASSTHRTKDTAVAAGRKQAKSAKAEHVIHNKDGKIGKRNSYGGDPYPPKG
jgi:transcriptional regulator with XRE-family HTH domain